MIELNIHKGLLGSNGPMRLDVNLSIKEHDFVALAGQSGSGKTTLLRILSGLESAEGNINVSGEIWLNAKTSFSNDWLWTCFIAQPQIEKPIPEPRASLANA